MAKTSKKSTRKFEKNHLKDTIEKRKAGAKIKQRQQIKTKRQARNAKDAEFLGKGQDQEDGGKSQATGAAKEDPFGKMNVDDFFQGGFEIPEKLAKKSKPVSEKLGKRKRLDHESEDDSSEASFDEEPSWNDTDEESGADDETGMSKGAMDALAEKDPEFYKYLKENDPEALQFDEDADLAEVDGLSASDDEEQPKKEKTKEVEGQCRQ
jgi:nucleolar complex protein 2